MRTSLKLALGLLALSVSIASVAAVQSGTDAATPNEGELATLLATGQGPGDAVGPDLAILLGEGDQPIDPATTRHLSSRNGFDYFIAQTAKDDVCLLIVHATDLATDYAKNCAPPLRFDEHGLSLELGVAYGMHQVAPDEVAGALLVPDRVADSAALRTVGEVSGNLVYLNPTRDQGVLAIANDDTEFSILIPGRWEP